MTLARTPQPPRAPAIARSDASTTLPGELATAAPRGAGRLDVREPCVRVRSPQAPSIAAS